MRIELRFSLKEALYRPYQRGSKPLSPLLWGSLQRFQ